MKERRRGRVGAALSSALRCAAPVSAVAHRVEDQRREKERGEHPEHRGERLPDEAHDVVHHDPDETILFLA